MAAQKYIIDTDPGIDDAAALFMALAAHKQGLIDLLAITLVNGNTDIDHAKINIMRILETAGMEIPVFVGARKGLVHDVNKDNFHGLDGFNCVQFDWTPDVSKVKENAVLEILNLVTKYPNQIKVLALGPLTNLATCIAIDMEFTSQLISIELMGGNTSSEGNVTTAAEFNFHADPEAAFVVIHRSLCPIIILPWETCIETRIDWDWRMGVLGKVNTKQIQLLNRLEMRFFQEKFFGNQYISCDQLAFACSLDPSLIEERSSYKATVELNGLSTRGMMLLEKRMGGIIWETSNLNKVVIIKSINVEKLQSFMMKMLSYEFK